MKKILIKKQKEKIETRLDLGCGKNKKPEFLGVDIIKFDGVDIAADLTQKWQWEDNSIDEAFCSHFIEHLEGIQRVYFVNELYRVLKPDAKCTIITPHWASCRAYGDIDHKFPPISEFWFFYLSKEWRKINAPHNDIEFNQKGYSCNFDATWGYSLHQSIVGRNQEYQTNALTFYKEAAQDIICTLTKKKES